MWAVTPDIPTCALPGCNREVERDHEWRQNYCGIVHKRAHRTAAAIGTFERAPTGRDLNADARIIADIWDTVLGVDPGERMKRKDYAALMDLFDAYVKRVFAN